MRRAWYRAKECDRRGKGHLAGHPRKGNGFALCGKTIGREVTKEVYRGSIERCAMCLAEQKTIDDRIRRATQPGPEEATVVSVMTGAERVPTPELEKMQAVKEKSQAIGEFLEWLNGTKGWTLAKAHTHTPECAGWDKGRGRFNPRGMFSEYCKMGPDGRLWMEPYTTEKLLAEFFEIDLNKVEEERRAILAAIRALSPST